MKGNSIILTSAPRGIFLEGTIGDTSKPGTLMQVKAATVMVGGRPTFVASATGTDGKASLAAVLLEDDQQGFDATTAYVSGRRGRLYVPLAGEELNLRLGEVAGTGNTVAIGDRFILDAEDGVLVPDSGSPLETIAVALEVLTMVAGNSLCWCMWIR